MVKLAFFTITAWKELWIGYQTYIFELTRSTDRYSSARITKIAVPGNYFKYTNLILNGLSAGLMLITLNFRNWTDVMLS